jgi:hypothetical protein
MIIKLTHARMKTIAVTVKIRSATGKEGACYTDFHLRGRPNLLVMRGLR